MTYRSDFEGNEACLLNPDLNQSTVLETSRNRLISDASAQSEHSSNSGFSSDDDPNMVSGALFSNTEPKRPVFELACGMGHGNYSDALSSPRSTPLTSVMTSSWTSTQRPLSVQPTSPMMSISTTTSAVLPHRGMYLVKPDANSVS